MTPKKYASYPENIHFSETQTDIEIQNFEPQKVTGAYICMIISEYLTWDFDKNRLRRVLSLETPNDARSVA